MHFEPIKSFRYDTVNLDFLLQKDPKDAIAYINNLKASGIDNLRVEFTINKSDILNVIKNYYRTNNSIKIFENFDKTISGSIDLETKEKYSEYDFILDNSYTDIEKFIMYVNKNEGFKFITADELIKILED